MQLEERRDNLKPQNLNLARVAKNKFFKGKQGKGSKSRSPF